MRTAYLGTVPHTPRQYIRALLLQFGIGDEAAYKLALRELRPTDTFLCSYPKSGNTWLRFLLAHLLSARTDITLRNVDAVVPDLYMARQTADQLASPRFLKTHDAWFDYYPKTIYVVRDVRDVLLSYYHYQVGLGAFSGSLSEFIGAADTLHPFGTWHDHVSAALRFRAAHPDRLLLLRYEDLQQTPEQELEKVIAFTGLVPARSIAEAVALSEFGRLRKLEEKHGSAFSDKSGGHFFRSGRSGEGREQLSATDQQHLAAANRDLLRQLGYPV